MDNPSTGNSASLKLKYRLAMMFANTSSNWSTIMSCITCATFKTFIRASLWASELSIRDKVDIFDGVFPNWSIILKSLFLINLRSSWPSFGDTFFLCFSAWSYLFIILLPLELTTFDDLLVGVSPRCNTLNPE